MSTAPTKRKWSARRQLLTGFIALVVLVFGLGAWSALANIAGAIVASGMIEVEGNRQVVQHPEGGVVGIINVDDGDTPQELDILGQESEIDITGLKSGQERLFSARADSLRQEATQLDQRQDQIRKQIAGSQSQLEALEKQLDLINLELDDQQSLLDKGLAQASRVLSLQREEARLRGQVGELTSAIAESEGRITEIEIEILKLGTQLREEAITTLRDLQYTEIELKERRISALETLSRLDVRATSDGVIYGNW